MTILMSTNKIGFYKNMTKNFLIIINYHRILKNLAFKHHKWWLPEGSGMLPTIAPSLGYLQMQMRSCIASVYITNLWHLHQRVKLFCFRALDFWPWGHELKSHQVRVNDFFKSYELTTDSYKIPFCSIQVIERALRLFKYWSTCN